MKKILAPLSVAALLLLSACGSEASNGEAPTVEPAAPAESSDAATAEPTPTSDATPKEESTTSASSEAEKSDRGNLIKEVGEAAGLASAEGEQMVTFVINSITVDGQCTAEFATAPENGHIVILDVSVETTPALAESDYAQFSMNPHSWKAIAPNGTTSNASPGTAATYGCLPQAELLPDNLGPAEKATGKVVLDVENPEGILIFQEPTTSGGGWEWNYPAP